MLEFSDRRMLEAQMGDVSRRFRAPVLPGQSGHLDQLASELEEYFEGRRRSFDVAVATRGTPFQERVWAGLAAIPYGTTVSYGELAGQIGRPGASRAVGRANGSNRVAIVIPCHRVIQGDGTLGGYGGGLWRKARLLEIEGVQLPAAPAIPAARGEPGR
jgi:AraC family transcriptional regulator of adaptative response/methylated-DNA-[protein]-cysteine methyltransferase